MQKHIEQLNEYSGDIATAVQQTRLKINNRIKLVKISDEKEIKNVGYTPQLKKSVANRSAIAKEEVIQIVKRQAENMG